MLAWDKYILQTDSTSMKHLNIKWEYTIQRLDALGQLYCHLSCGPCRWTIYSQLKTSPFSWCQLHALKCLVEIAQTPHGSWDTPVSHPIVRIGSMLCYCYWELTSFPLAWGASLTMKVSYFPHGSQPPYLGRKEKNRNKNKAHKLDSFDELLVGLESRHAKS